MTAYHDGSAAAIAAATRSGSHRVLDINGQKPLAEYTYKAKNKVRKTFLSRAKRVLSQIEDRIHMTTEPYKHLILYPEDLNPRGRSKFAAMRRDVDELTLGDMTLPKDWEMYEVIMFVDPDKETDKILKDNLT